MPLSITAAEAVQYWRRWSSSSQVPVTQLTIASRRVVERTSQSRHCFLFSYVSLPVSTSEAAMHIIVVAGLCSPGPPGIPSSVSGI